MLGPLDELGLCALTWNFVRPVAPDSPLLEIVPSDSLWCRSGLPMLTRGSFSVQVLVLQV